MALLRIYPQIVLGDAAFDGSGAIWADMSPYTGAYFDSDGLDVAYANFPLTPEALTATSITVFFEYMSSPGFDGTVWVYLNPNGARSPGDIGYVALPVGGLPSAEYPSTGTFQYTLTDVDYADYDTTRVAVLNRLAFGDSGVNPPRISFQGMDVAIITAYLDLQVPDPEPEPEPETDPDPLLPPDVGVLKLKIAEGSGDDVWLQMG